MKSYNGKFQFTFPKPLKMYLLFQDVLLLIKFFLKYSNVGVPFICIYFITKLHLINNDIVFLKFEILKLRTFSHSSNTSNVRRVSVINSALKLN